MKKGIWISYDLGVKGDYDSLFHWLDLHDARECTGTTAFLYFDVNSDVITELKESVKNAIDIDAKTRIYIVFQDKNRKLKGRFLFGSRRDAPWTGFAPKDNTEEIDDAG